MKTFRKILKVVVTIDEKIKDEKLQFNIYRETAKILTLPSAKIDKYEYLKGKEISLLVQATQRH